MLEILRMAGAFAKVCGPLHLKARKKDEEMRTEEKVLRVGLYEAAVEPRMSRITSVFDRCPGSTMRDLMLLYKRAG